MSILVCMYLWNSLSKVQFKAEGNVHKILQTVCRLKAFDNFSGFKALLYLSVR